MLFYFLLYILYFVLLYFKIRLPITCPLRTFSAVVLYCTYDRLVVPVDLTNRIHACSNAPVFFKLL